MGLITPLKFVLYAFCWVLNLARYVVCVPLSWTLSIFTMVFCIPLALCAKKDGNLPGPLYLFQTFDATLDAGWKDDYGYDPNAPLWWNRAKWLFRNPAYGWDYYVFGIPMHTDEWKVLVWNGTVFWAIHPKWGYFNFYYFGALGNYKLGWKAYNYWDDDTSTWRAGYQWGPKLRTMFGCSPNPFKRPKS